MERNSNVIRTNECREPDGPAAACATQQSIPAKPGPVRVGMPVRIGTQVDVYSTEWIGARLGIVVRSWGGDACNVYVMLDGGNDGELLSKWRLRPEGNTLMSLAINRPMTEKDRNAHFDDLYAIKGRHGILAFHAELPPPHNIAFVPVQLPS